MTEEKLHPYHAGWRASRQNNYDNPHPIESDQWKQYALGFCDATIAILGGWWKEEEKE